jgi:hypothetical protein
MIFVKKNMAFEEYIMIIKLILIRISKIQIELREL